MKIVEFALGYVLNYLCFMIALSSKSKSLAFYIAEIKFC